MQPSSPRTTGPYTLRFTPAEWRALLHDGSFLKSPDNSFSPRRLMGLPVEIIPDHDCGRRGRLAREEGYVGRTRDG